MKTVFVIVTNQCFNTYFKEFHLVCRCLSWSSAENYYRTSVFENKDYFQKHLVRFQLIKSWSELKMWFMLSRFYYLLHITNDLLLSTLYKTTFLKISKRRTNDKGGWRRL